MSLKEPDRFYGSRLKVERAKHHLAELINRVVDYLKSKPFKVVVEQDPASSNHLWTLRVRHGVPGVLSAIIGDVIHNLRSSLDLLASDLVSLKGGNAKNVYFPFGDDADGFERMVKERHIDRAGEDVVNIIRSLKPFHGGDEMLRAIHDLDVTDKHKALIPAAHYAGIKGLKMSNASGPIFTIGSLHVGPIKDGQVLMSLPPASNIKVGGQFQPTLEITFGHDQPLEGRAVVETLRQLTQLVESIIDAFDRTIP